MEAGFLTMSTKEFDRLEVLQRVLERRLKQVEAAGVLRITTRVVRRLLPKAYFVTLYAKPAGRDVVDMFVKEFKQSKWIHFPWDIEYKFATPIKDGGRARSGPD